MQSQSFHTTKMSRKRFLQLSLVAIGGLLMWSPFRESRGSSLLGSPALPNELASQLSFEGVQDVKFMTQREYDEVAPQPDTVYVITA